MKNLEPIKARYLKEPFDKKLGHLASDLARISSFIEDPENIQAINGVLEESKFFIEWSVSEAPSHIQALFSEMQIKLSLWQLKLQQQKEKSEYIEEVKRLTRQWSDRLIEMSGLVKT